MISSNISGVTYYVLCSLCTLPGLIFKRCSGSCFTCLSKLVCKRLLEIVDI